MLDLGMGFDLMKSFLYTVALIFMVLSLVACSKDEDQDFGPEVDKNQISEIQKKALSKSDPSKLRKGEFVYLIRTQDIFSGSTPIKSLLSEEGITVTDREEFPEYSILTIVRETIEHSGKETISAKFKDVYYLANEAAQTLPAPQQTTTSDGSVTPTEPAAPETTPVAQTPVQQKEDAPADEAAPEDDGCPGCTYHNLTVREERVRRPGKVEEREPCPPGKDCTIAATHIFYDVVIREEGQSPRKNQVELLISTDTPYFGNILKNCITTAVTFEDARPLVRQCTAVLDYQFPANSPVTP